VLVEKLLQSQENAAVAICINLRPAPQHFIIFCELADESSWVDDVESHGISILWPI